jgi:hypothetical protein
MCICPIVLYCNKCLRDHLNIQNFIRGKDRDWFSRACGSCNGGPVQAGGRREGMMQVLIFGCILPPSRMIVVGYWLERMEEVFAVVPPHRHAAPPDLCRGGAVVGDEWRRAW